MKLSPWNIFACAGLVVFFMASSAFALEIKPRVPAAVKEQLLSDLRLLAEITSAKPASQILQQIYGGNVDGKTYSDWFDARVWKVDIDPCGGAPGVAACVFGIMPKWMYLTPQYAKLSMPAIVRLGTILHEARHNDPLQTFPHENCPTPFRDENGNDVRGYYSQSLLEGLPACDSSELGSYGAQLSFLLNVASRCESCTEKVRADAKILGMDTLNRMLGAALKQKLKKDLEIP